MPPAQTLRTVIWFWVSVPLLSVQTTEVEPRVSITDSFLTSTPRWARRWTAIARVNVTVRVRPSGRVATMMPIASRKALAGV